MFSSNFYQLSVRSDGKMLQMDRQLGLYGDGSPGKYDSDSVRLPPGPGEVDKDICVPSTVLPAIVLRWMVLFTD
jgi:hypothetical protein